jgi:HNH endonuclease
MRGTREERFWAKVDKAGPIPVHAPDLGSCWLWTGAPDTNGYGQLRTGNTLEKAHRISWEIHFGKPILNVCHRCDNPLCVKPAHLFEGTQQDNIADRQAKGRHNRKPGDLRHHVPRGEEMGLATKLRTEQVLEIRRRAATGEQLKAIASDYGIGPQHVGNIVSRKNWTHI